MGTSLNEMNEAGSWRLLVDAAVSAAKSRGYKCVRLPGKGLSNLWRFEKDGRAQIASIRTTRDRAFTFLPLEQGHRWKTLDDADLVMVAAVDQKDSPRAVEVYLFDAKIVRKRFDEAYAARREAGHTIKDNFGFWLNLDRDDRSTPSAVGSGLAEEFDPIAVYQLDDLVGSAGEPMKLVPRTPKPALEAEAQAQAGMPPQTIAEVMGWARENIARIAGVRPEAVKLDLKLEY